MIAPELGIALGAAVSYSRTLMQAVYPTIVFFQLIPKVALAPVFLLWFGTGFDANVIFYNRFVDLEELKEFFGRFIDLYTYENDLVRR